MPTPARLDGRNGEIWRRVTIYRWTHERAAEHFGISRQRVDQIVKAVRDELKPLLAEEMVQQSNEFLADLQQRALDIADMTPAPVTVGKDGNVLYDDVLDENGNPVLDEDGLPKRAIVRDFSGRLAAIMTAKNIDAEIRKLHGLNAPEKREITGALRYEIVGVDDEDLT